MPEYEYPCGGECRCGCHPLEVPSSQSWEERHVARWITKLGFPQYQDCFASNGITGRKLIFVNGSTLPSIGITDFEHIKVISQAVQKLLDIRDPHSGRSISYPRRDPMGLFLERKAPSGPNADALTLEEFMKEMDASLAHAAPQGSG
ncbi:sterile alpha motif domain-containing protein 15-like [Leucoraja erinacea]|uniref:sterile alpha motif domain-containing protein 15-like n=1 Tax=Leucoraja erinaceus TaxID=7782 RepID=UPI002454EFBA|nr:sterile alpha motif domain-containing protein 15-like [Leucoraja erinacea]XP_055496258.1 sterile alpha motif domain-containing protein 15-like [Leucoraja erinacea]